MSALPADLDTVGHEARTFRDRFLTLQLATCSNDGVPTASYAPYALSAADTFYIYVSELAAHTPNLHAGRPLSALFIESEADAEHVFARRRLTCRCEVESLPRGDDRFDAALDALRERFGPFMDHLRTFQDFHAFALIPRHAIYVRGFAQAYELPDADFNAIRHQNEQGHRNA